MRTALPASATAVALSLVLAGCAGDDSRRIERDLSTTRTTTNQLGDEEAAGKRAEELVFQYVGARDTTLGDPATHRNGDGMKGNSEGSALREVLVEADQLHRARQRQEGSTTVASRKVTEVELSPAAGGSDSTGGLRNPYVVVEACLDASEVRIVSTSGAPVKAEQPTPRRLVRFGVINRSFPVVSEWRVAWLKELKRSC